MVVSYKQKPIHGQFDAIVIGSGVGGLAAAAILAKRADKRVLVLERHFRMGGLSQSFTRPGWEWDVGVHYVGEVGETGALRRPFDVLTEGRLAWAPLPDVYDRVHIGERTYDIVAGRARFLETMKARFPTEAGALDRYVELVEACRRASGAFFMDKALSSTMSRALGSTLREPFLEHASRTTAEVIESLTEDRELYAVLTAQFGNYGLPPRQSSFAVHAGIVGHFMDGAYFPVGGASAISAALAPTIGAAGGMIFLGAEVDHVVVEDDRARGVCLSDGREVRAPIVISDAGAAITFGKLVRGSAPTTLRPALGHLCLYVGLDASDEALGLTGTNRWIYRDEKHDEGFARFLADPDGPLPVVYESFPSAKDPSFQSRFPGRATIDVIAPAPYEWFAPWADGPWRRRGAEYEALKARFTERLTDALLEKFPSVRGHVAFRELSTPITTRHFAAHPHGEMCGLDHTPERFAHAPGPRTPIRGLYMSGQDVALIGVGGAFTGGALAAAAIEGPNVRAGVMWP
jgi:all-trans-retinol 13,14-reductase